MKLAIIEDSVYANLPYLHEINRQPRHVTIDTLLASMLRETEAQIKGTKKQLKKLNPWLPHPTLHDHLRTGQHYLEVLSEQRRVNQSFTESQ